jgi:hypothetical protein
VTIAIYRDVSRSLDMNDHSRYIVIHEN